MICPEVHMGVVSEVKGDGTKVPFFDPPKRAGVGGRPIACGSKVALFCQGIQVTAQVMVVGQPGTMFVGRVVGFTPCTKIPDGVNAGDFVRFQPEDVHWVE